MAMLLIISKLVKFAIKPALYATISQTKNVPNAILEIFLWGLRVIPVVPMGILAIQLPINARSAIQPADCVQGLAIRIAFLVLLLKSEIY